LQILRTQLRVSGQYRGKRNGEGRKMNEGEGEQNGREREERKRG
jgi:hypothetical protein